MSRVVHLGLVGGADRGAVLGEQHDLLAADVDCHAGLASWLTAAPKTRGSRVAAGTIDRRTSGTRLEVSRALVSRSWRRPRRDVRRLVVLHAAVPDRLHGGPRLGEPERDALAGERVDVAGRVADQEHPALGAAPRTLPQRAGAPDPLPRHAGQPLGEQPVLGEQLRERPGPVGEDRDADQVVTDRGHVGLGPAGPVHLDVGRPRRHRDVAAQPEPAVPSGRELQPQEAAGRRVQAVGGDEVGGRLAVDQHVVVAVLHLLHRAATRS